MPSTRRGRRTGMQQRRKTKSRGQRRRSKTKSRGRRRRSKTKSRGQRRRRSSLIALAARIIARGSLNPGVLLQHRPRPPKDERPKTPVPPKPTPAEPTMEQKRQDILETITRLNQVPPPAQKFENALPQLTGDGSDLRDSVVVYQLDALGAVTYLRTYQPDNPNKIFVLNFADPTTMGGSTYTKFDSGQEQELFYRTNLPQSLSTVQYPWANRDGVVYSPDISVLADANYALLPDNEQATIDVISAAALHKPELTDDRQGYQHPGDRATMIHKMQNVLRVAVQHGRRFAVLGAWGCGHFGNPPQAVAEMWAEVLFGDDREFVGYFDQFLFAVPDQATYDVFRDVFDR